MATADPSTTLTGTIDVPAGQILAEPGPTTLGADEDFGPLIEGAGTFETAGSTTLVTGGIVDLYIGDGLTWINTGTVDAGGAIEFGLGAGDTDTIVNQAGATFALTTDAGIAERILVSGATATLDNDGLLTKTGGTGTATIGAAIDSIGTVQVTAGTLAFAAGGNIAGFLDSAANAAIAFTAGHFTLADVAVGANLAIGGGSVTIQTPTALPGSLTETAGTLTIAADTTASGPVTATSGLVAIDAGDTLTLTGPVTLGANEFNPDIAGPGLLVTTGAVDIPAQSGGAVGVRVGDGLTWSNTGAVTAATSIDFGLSSGDTTSFVNQAGATLTFDGHAGLTGFLGINTTATLTNAGLVVIDSTATSTIAAATINTGTIDVQAGTLAMTAAVTGAGTIAIAPEATLVLDGPASGQTFAFAGPGTLDLQDPSALAAATPALRPALATTVQQAADRIAGLQSGDTIEFGGAGLDAATLSGSTLAVTLGNGNVLDFTVSGPAQPDQIRVTGNEITVACFARGTRLATDRGPRPVETLAVGDRVLTQSGAHRPVVWLGRRRIDCDRHPRPEKVHPVRIAAHSFGANQPERDLVLSPDHALCRLGVLIPVHLLVNGTTIRQEPTAEITYFHVELATHDVILAENLPVETYLDTGNRSMFANAPLVDLHPSFDPNGAGDVARPMVFDGPLLHAARAHLGALLERSRAS